MLNDSEARMLIVSTPYVAAIDAIRANVPGVEHFVALDGGEAEWIDFAQWTHAQPDDDFPAARTDSEADLVQIYTSGTTGQPKGAVLTQRSIVSNVLQIGTGEHRGPPGERSLVVGPMLHAGVVWSVLAPLAWGASIFILEDFDPSNVVRIMDTENIGYASLVPTMLQACVRVVGAAEREYASLRVIQCGSAALVEDTLRRATSIFKCHVVQGYGLTESTAGGDRHVAVRHAARPGARTRAARVGWPGTAWDAGGDRRRARAPTASRDDR